ncbi:hypothetical protein DFH09DRAFT_1497973, partial [Mycena vulgaris]
GPHPPSHTHTRTVKFQHVSPPSPISRFVAIIRVSRPPCTMQHRSLCRPFARLSFRISIPRDVCDSGAHHRWQSPYGAPRRHHLSPPPIAAHYPAPCSPASSPLTAFWFESPAPVDALATPSMEPPTGAGDVGVGGWGRAGGSTGEDAGAGPSPAGLVARKRTRESWVYWENSWWPILLVSAHAQFKPRSPRARELPPVFGAGLASVMDSSAPRRRYVYYTIIPNFPLNSSILVLQKNRFPICVQSCTAGNYGGWMYDDLSDISPSICAILEKQWKGSLFVIQLEPMLPGRPGRLATPLLSGYSELTLNNSMDDMGLEAS